MSIKNTLDFYFEIIHQSKKSRARVGRIHTPHGIIETPNFVPVATNAALKTVDSSIANQLNIQLMFCNTYHLLLHPGANVVEEAGGLHRFMNRKGVLITDSGGFQVFSLAYGGVANELKSKGQKQQTGSVLKINEEGVLFRSYRDGSPITLTPETSVQAQKKLGADIIIPLDELPPYHTHPEKLRKSLDRTHRWEKRSLEEHKRDPRQQAMYAVVHGGIDKKLRQKSAAFLGSCDFDGFAIGGSLGKNRAEMITMLSHLMPHIPSNKPNHLLGIGDLPSIEAGIPLGIDTFDSSYPTKCARHGILFTKHGPMKITSTKWRNVFDKISDAPVCKDYSIAYLHHLFKAHETTAHTLASIHNTHYMMSLMQNYRNAILEDRI